MHPSITLPPIKRYRLPAMYPPINLSLRCTFQSPSTHNAPFNHTLPRAMHPPPIMHPSTTLLLNTFLHPPTMPSPSFCNASFNHHPPQYVPSSSYDAITIFWQCILQLFRIAHLNAPTSMP
eukprot:1160580-Pelagomonas_calceolata.AAC.5